MTESPATGSRLARPRSFWLGLGTLLFGAAGVIAVHVFHEGVFHAVPGCMLYDLTGIYCIGCGGTRSLYALANGHIATAFSLNLFAPCIAVGVVVWAVNRMVAGVRGRGFMRWRWPWWLIILLIVVGLAYMILRNLPLAPFTSLAP